MFGHSFVHLFGQSFVPLFIHLFVRSIIYPAIRSFVYSLIHLFMLTSRLTWNQHFPCLYKINLASAFQIKVWFQNRRTKHKKEEEGGSETPLGKSPELSVAVQPAPGIAMPPIAAAPTIPLFFPALPFALQQVDNSAIAAVNNTEGADVSKQNIFRPFCI